MALTQAQEYDLTFGFGHEALQAAFERVRDPNDWKAPINFVGYMTDDQIRVTRAAIIYFTATVPEITTLRMTGLVEGEKTVEIRAVGYRMGPAGDH